MEAQVGITKKNIRFYEERGLLSPRRDIGNGYRDYDEQDVTVLRQIKLLRKLGVPLEEIHRMQVGESTVADGMRRHLVTLEREQRNLEQSMALCHTLKDWETPIDMLDAQALLERMEALERIGTTFQNKQRLDTKTERYVSSAGVAIVIVMLLVGVIVLMAWGFAADGANEPPLAFLKIVLLGIPAVVILGVLLALIQRLREIRKGEIDDAKNY